LPIASARNARKLDTRRLGLTAPRLSALNAYCISSIDTSIDHCVACTPFHSYTDLQIHRLIMLCPVVIADFKQKCSRLTCQVRFRCCHCRTVDI